MRLETKRVITLTKEEQRVIKQLYVLLQDDNDLSAIDVWNILTDIYNENSEYCADYGYDIRIIDQAGSGRYV